MDDTRPQEQALAPVRVDRVLVGEPVSVGGWTVTPEARLRGLMGEGWDGGGHVGGATLHLEPVAVTVANAADGSTQRIELADMTSEAVKGMVSAGLVIAGVSLLVQILARKRRGPAAL